MSMPLMVPESIVLIGWHRFQHPAEAGLVFVGRPKHAQSDIDLLSLRVEKLRIKKLPESTTHPVEAYLLLL